jgi:hypothetical protein
VPAARKATRLPKQPAPASKVNGPLAAALADTISDGREQYMRDWIWGRVLDWHRACPIPPTNVESESACADAFLAWVEHVDSRIPGAHAAKAERLEQEGRGWSEFQRKWRYAMAQWDTKVADEAGKARPNGPQQQTPPVDGADDEDDWGPSPSGNPYPGAKQAPGPRTILTTPEFMATLRPADYIVDGLLQRGRLHALTSATGHGKTAVALCLGAHIATGRNLGALEVEPGEVLFLAGENPDDLCIRFYAAVKYYGIKPEEMNISVMPGNFPMSPADADALRQQIDDRPEIASLTPRPLALIVMDTSAAYFDGDDENHNVQAGKWARTLRTLTQCRGNPAVLVLCHPTKNAHGMEGMLPRGGGAFLNELDVNLALWSEAMAENTRLHWAGKIRGADFTPVSFSLVQVKMEDVCDRKGRPQVSIVATLQTDADAEGVLDRAITDENTVLEWLRRHPGISVRAIANNAGWPNPSKVHRLLLKLERGKYADRPRGKWRITPKGERELTGEDGDDA